MSRIDELIEDLCPDGVPSVTLGSFVEEKTSRAGAQTELSVFGISNSLGFVASEDLFSASRASADRANYKVVKSENFAYNPSRINVGSIAMNNQDRDVIVSPMYVVFSITNGLHPKFFEFFVRSSLFKSQVLSNIEVGARFRFTFEALARVLIQVPPLEVQREIVSILDKFTQLEAELEAELEARRIQYEVTRDRLLDFSGDLSDHPMSKVIREKWPQTVEYKTLGELLENIPRGKRLTKAELPEHGTIPVFHGGLEPIGFTDQANTEAMTVMVINVGASAGSVGWSEEPFWFSDGCFALPHASAVLPKYLYYCALANQRFFVERVRRAGIPTLAPASVLTLSIPVPPLEIQSEIVSILDKLDALVNDITIGLPAEIAARRKQYEYYRNKLLTFKELEAA